jgi:hypothetical protein
MNGKGNDSIPGPKMDLPSQIVNDAIVSGRHWISFNRRSMCRVVDMGPLRRILAYGLRHVHCLLFIVEAVLQVIDAMLLDPTLGPQISQPSVSYGSTALYMHGVLEEETRPNLTKVCYPLGIIPHETCMQNVKGKCKDSQELNSHPHDSVNSHSHSHYSIRSVVVALRTSWLKVFCHGGWLRVVSGLYPSSVSFAHRTVASVVCLYYCAESPFPKFRCCLSKLLAWPRHPAAYWRTCVASVMPLSTGRVVKGFRS